MHLEIKHDQSITDYHASGSIGSSRIRAFKPGISETQAVAGVKMEPTKAMEFGQAVHRAIEHHGKLSAEYVCSPYPDWRTKESKEWRSTMEAMGKICLKADEWAEAEAKFGRIFDQLKVTCPEILEQINKAKSIGCLMQEASFYSGIFKCRPDLLMINGARVTVIDWKAAAMVANYEQQIKHAINLGYHIQRHHYIDKVLQHHFRGKEIRWIFCFIQPDEPFEIVFDEFKSDFYELGKLEWGEYYNRMIQCNFDHPKTYCHDGILSSALPEYYQRRLEA